MTDKKKDSEIEELEIRFFLNKATSEDDELLKRFLEMSNYLSPIKHSQLTKILLNRAYEYWFLPEIKKDKNQR